MFLTVVLDGSEIASMPLLITSEGLFYFAFFGETITNLF